uniref:Uncharacterized protein n=1 Tax=Lepeophtheirus salmonis TaxID=72036 RepID=A0A0K2T456_LEPSM
MYIVHIRKNTHFINVWICVVYQHKSKLEGFFSKIIVHFMSTNYVD